MAFVLLMKGHTLLFDSTTPKPSDNASSCLTPLLAHSSSGPPEERSHRAFQTLCRIRTPPSKAPGHLLVQLKATFPHTEDGLSPQRFTPKTRGVKKNYRFQRLNGMSKASPFRNKPRGRLPFASRTHLLLDHCAWRVVTFVVCARVLFLLHNIPVSVVIPCDIQHGKLLFYGVRRELLDGQPVQTLFPAERQVLIRSIHSQ